MLSTSFFDSIYTVGCLCDSAQPDLHISQRIGALLVIFFGVGQIVCIYNKPAGSQCNACLRYDTSWLSLAAWLLPTDGCTTVSECKLTGSTLSPQVVGHCWPILASLKFDPAHALAALKNSLTVSLSCTLGQVHSCQGIHLIPDKTLPDHTH